MRFLFQMFVFYSVVCVCLFVRGHIVLNIMIVITRSWVWSCFLFSSVIIQIVLVHLLFWVFLRPWHVVVVSFFLCLWIGLWMEIVTLYSISFSFSFVVVLFGCQFVELCIGLRVKVRAMLEVIWHGHLFSFPRSSSLCSLVALSFSPRPCFNPLMFCVFLVCWINLSPCKYSVMHICLSHVSPFSSCLLYPYFHALFGFSFHGVCGVSSCDGVAWMDDEIA